MRLWLSLSIACLAVACSGEPTAEAPVAERRPVESTHFGERRIDPYAWMRDLDDPAVREHLERENRYTDAILEPLAELRDTLHREMLARVPELETFPPEPDGAWEYFERQEAALDYPRHLRRPIGGGAEEVVLDLNELAAGHAYFRIPTHAVDPSGKRVAYLADTDGDDVAALHLRELEDGTDRQIHPEILSAWSLAWSADGSSLYYTRPDATQRSSELWRHRLGDDPANDVRLMQEPDGRFWVEVATSRSGDAIFVHAAADDTSRIFVIDANDPDAAPRALVPGRDGVRVFSICHRRAEGHGGWYYVLDNDEGARDGRLIRRRVDAPEGAAWELVAPELDGVQIRGFAILRDWFVFEERRDGERVVRVMRHDGSDEHIVPLTPRPGFAAFELGPEYDRESVRIVSSGLRSPFAMHDYDPARRSSVKLFEKELAIDASRFEAGVIHGTAEDGARIPVTFIRPDDAPTDGSGPALLTGYGAQGVILEPGARLSRQYASLLERGFTIAIVHPRGGGYLGRRWHDAARRETHALTYSDAVAGAAALFEAGFTRPERLALDGSSAGGLLVAAAINLRPDLARVVVARVPFVDCLNSLLDASLPVTQLDYPEYGDPATDERIFREILSFAPYENLLAADYPEILAIGGISDPRVAFWEPAKWVARLRHRRTDDGVTLLRMKFESGHEGASGRTDALYEQAEQQAFILDRVGALAR